MFPIGTNWNRRGESRSYPGRFSPQPEQIARLLARGPASNSHPRTPTLPGRRRSSCWSAVATAARESGSRPRGNRLWNKSDRAGGHERRAGKPAALPPVAHGGQGHGRPAWALPTDSQDATQVAMSPVEGGGDAFRVSNATPYAAIGKQKATATRDSLTHQRATICCKAAGSPTLSAKTSITP